MQDEYYEGDEQQVDQGQPSSRTFKQNSGNIRQNVSDGLATAAKATRGLSSVEKGAAVAAKAGSKALRAGGAGLEKGGKAVEAAGKGIESGSNAAGQALSAIPYVGGALGGIVKGVGTALGKGTEATGKGMQTAGKGMKKGADSLDRQSAKLEAKSKAHKNAAKKLEDTAKKVDKGDFKGGKEKDAAKNAAGQAANQAKNKAVEALKKLINPADPELALKKTIRIVVIIILIMLLFFIVILCGYEDSKTKDITRVDDSSEELVRCDGNIKLALLGELEPPVALTEGQLITFDSETNYGYTNVFMHNGLDLTEKSTGTKKGDPVYSVYDKGVVIQSTVDNTYPVKDIKNGWVKIEYKMTIEKKEYDFIITYGGLEVDSFKLKKGDIVNKKDVIGKVDSIEETLGELEDGIHFGFYDNLTKRYLNPVNLFIPCYKVDGGNSALKVHEVGITKADFKKATTDYLNSVRSSCKVMKSWDLDLVYDLSVKNNLNPEFVIIRADKEGCSPYSKGLTSYNNYWAIGCTNGSKLSQACTKYSSFEKGITGLANLKIVKESNTLEELMSKYAYLGDFWFNTEDNTKNTSLGGCYFFPYIKEYMSSERVSVVSQACVKGKWCRKGGKGDCLKTTDEDKKAYTKYLCKDMDTMYNKVYAKYHNGGTE